MTTRRQKRHVDNRPPNLDPPALQLALDARGGPRAILEALRPELEAIPAAEVMSVNLDIPKGVIAAQRSHELRQTLRPRVVRELPFANHRAFDELDSYAETANLCHMGATMDDGPLRPIKPLLEKLISYRSLFSTDLAALVKRELIPPGIFKLISRRKSAKKVAVEMKLFLGAMREHLEVIEKYTAIRESEIAQVEEIDDLVLDHSFKRKRLAGPGKKALDLRNRGFTLFIRAYAEVKRMIEFLYWDKPKILEMFPSLHTAPHKRRKKEATRQSEGSPTRERRPRRKALPAPVEPEETPIGQLPAWVEGEIEES